MKKLLSVVAFVVVFALMVPVGNLIAGPPTGTALARVAADEPQRAAVHAVLEKKCSPCHLRETLVPYYARLPGARGLVNADRAEAARMLDFAPTLTTAELPPAAEPALAMIEREVTARHMPPKRFVALHWNARMSVSDRQLILGWIAETRAQRFAPEGLPRELQAAAVHPLPTQVAVDPAKVELGRRLYHDPRLSGDDTLACASCHDLARGGTDQARVSTGIRGQQGGINAPTTFNAGFQLAQFWDGRAATLADQAGGPPLNPVEMGSSWEQITAKLAADEAFDAEFRKVYPAGFSAASITDAIAAFERTLITPNSRFDQFLAGKPSSLTPEEEYGWYVFRREGCHTCHVGRLLGGRSYELMGRKADYFGPRGNPTPADDGRFAVTRRPADRHRFKVPTLRNVALTAPYFHDGTAADLPAAVRAMARYQTGRRLAEADVAAVSKFLGTLTGEYQGKPL